ncbi:methyl-accepting chemotaxis protein [Roseateles cellulosilyticus]|uniref:methyl-accepting chemotaxis protein n=1 Tax=Pelomonas cellulosilytica TaxID=2906762 RepID=UPI00272A94E7|nr:methyl-accepting chemotaxis protein [Pelomonas sp. P8]
MTKLTVKQQLILAFGAMAAMMTTGTGLAVYEVATANARFSSYIAGPSEREDEVLDLQIAADRRAIAVRDMVIAVTPADREASKSAAFKGHEEVTAHLKALKAQVATAADATDADRSLVSQIEQVEAKYGPVALAIVELASTGKHDEAIDKMNADCRPLLNALLSATRAYVNHGRERAQGDIAQAASGHMVERAVLIGGCALAVLVAAVMGTFITRHLIGALGAEPAELSEAARRVAEGDLGPVRGAEHAPGGSVLASMARMQSQLVNVITRVRTSADSIATASSQIASGNNELSGRTEEQASSLEETAASMEELSSTVRQNADNARQANQLAQSASAVAVRGGEVVGEVVETMKGINDSSRRIADIIGVIDGIAFQTNILALNAAVEAARAGEQGRGFAVVAGEVRSLASRSAEAAKEIKSLINASVERVEQGSTLVDRAGATMGEIVQSINRLTDIMGEITAASVEQSAGIGQVSSAVSQMDKATQQNAALVEESAAAAESLREQASHLVDTVAAFKLAAQHAAAVAATRPSTVESVAKAPRPVAHAAAKPQVARKPAPKPEASPRVAAAATVTPTAAGGGEWESF